MTLKALLKKSKFTYALAKAVRRVPYPIYTGWMRLCHALYGVDADKVYFSSFNGALYDDNPKAVAEALHAVCPRAKLVFRLNRRGMAQKDIPDYVTRVYAFSPWGIREMATAKVIVKNANILDWMVVFPDQEYVQTWHGDRGLKKMGLELWPDRKAYQRESRWLTLCVSGSRFATGTFESAFHYTGNVMQLGCPRNDILLNPPEGAAEAVRAALGVPEGHRVLLYAPTFRAATSGSKLNAAVSLQKV